MNILSLFDGMSCGQIALREAGIPVDKYFASEINPHAIKQTQYMFPNTVQVGDIQMLRAEQFPRIDLVIGGSPCFTGDTKVYTDNGYEEIRFVTPGTKVLTHKNRFKEVQKNGGDIKDVYELKIQGIVPTQVTSNHPYYVRKMYRKRDNKKRNLYRCWSDPEWIELKDLDESCFIGFPVIKTSRNPLGITKEEAKVLGRYIADGHTRKDFRVYDNRPEHRHWQLILSVGSKKLNRFNSNLNYSCYKHSNSTYRCVFSNKRLVQLAEKHCGIGAKDKKISKTLLDLPVNVLKELIEGYLEGDGYLKDGKYKCITISKDLVMGMSLAIAKVYKRHVSIYYYKTAKYHIIEGRKVNQENTWEFSFTKKPRKQDQAIYKDGFIWLPFKKKSFIGKKYVYNLEVEDDNSYTANNAIIHNCQGFSFSGNGLNFSHPQSRLFFEFERLWYEVKAINPEAIFLLENVVMKKEHQRVINDRMGVFPVRLNSNLVSAQNRDRLYWSNGRVKKVGLFGELHTDIPKPQDKQIYFPQILDKEVPVKYKLSEKAFDYINRDEMNMRYVQFHNNAKANPVTANYRKGVPYNVMLTEDGLRHLTPRECARLQTIPEWYLWHPDISDTQKYKMLGNGWTIEMIKHILNHVISGPNPKND